MNHEHLRELWARFLLGDALSNEEIAELQDAARHDESLRAEMAEDAELHGSLRALGWNREDPESAIRAFLDCLDAKSEESRFIGKVRTRMDQEPTPRAAPAIARRPAGRRTIWRGRTDRPGPLLVATFVAAAAVLGIAFLVVLFGSPGKSPQTTAGRPATTHADEPAERSPVEERKRPEDPRPAPPERAKPSDFTPPAPPAPEPEKPKPDPAPPRESPKPAAPDPEKPAPKEERTRTAVATVERAEGEAFVVSKSGRAPAKPRNPVLAGDTLETADPKSLLVVAYPDQTRLELGSGTLVTGMEAESGKRLTVEKGTLAADVARQPLGRPMVIATPHGEATVLGTTLRLVVDAEKSLLEVTEGKVRLRRAGDGKSVEVSTGHFAVAAVGVTLAAKLLPIDEIVLTAKRGTGFGPEWKPVQEDKASTGFAWEAEGTAYRVGGTSGNWLYPGVRDRRSYVEFQFIAEGNKDYHVWIRGQTPATGKRADNDEVALRVPDGIFEPKCPFLGRYGGDAFVFTNFSKHEGYGWVGGTDEGKGGSVQAVVRFTRTGPQTLRLYAVECPMRVDAIWLSATQKVRPADDTRGPQPPKK